MKWLMTPGIKRDSMLAEEITLTPPYHSFVGDPIKFEGLIYGPLNENGVIFLLSKIHDKSGIIIEAIQATYPDAKSRRKTAKGWEHDWEECPTALTEGKREVILSLYLEGDEYEKN